MNENIKSDIDFDTPREVIDIHIYHPNGNELITKFQAILVNSYNKLNHYHMRSNVYEEIPHMKNQGYKIYSLCKLPSGSLLIRDDLLNTKKVYEDGDLKFSVIEYLITDKPIDKKFVNVDDASYRIEISYPGMYKSLNSTEPPIKYNEYKIPVEFTCYCEITVFGTSLEEAIKYTSDNIDNFDVPDIEDGVICVLDTEGLMITLPEAIDKDINSSKDLTDEDIVILTEFYKNFN